MGNGSALAGFLLLLGAVAASPTSVQPVSAAGSYDRMSPSNQRVALALFDAQAASLAPIPPGGASARAAKKALTLDQIAALRQSGQGWVHVFQAMRTRGLVREDSLAQVMSRYEHRRHASLTPEGAGRNAGQTAHR
jgi:hypothetical protein